MVYRLLGDKPLSEPMLVYYYHHYLNSLKRKSAEIESKHEDVFEKKIVCKTAVIMFWF